MQLCEVRMRERVVAAVLLLLTALPVRPLSDTPQYDISVRLVPCRDWCHSRQLTIEVTSARDGYVSRRSIGLRPGTRSGGDSGVGLQGGTIRRIRTTTVVDAYGTSVQYRVDVFHGSSIVASKSGTIRIGSVDHVYLSWRVQPEA